MKNPIYIIFECDSTQSLNSYCLKGMSDDKSFIEREFDRLSAVFTQQNSERWYFMLAVLNPIDTVAIDENLFRQFNVLKFVQ